LGATWYCASLESWFPQGYPGSNPGHGVFFFKIFFLLQKFRNIYISLQKSNTMAKKIHTRVKRLRGLGSAHKHYTIFHPAEKKHGPKTFSTEASAHAWAKKQNIADYALKSVKRNKRFQVVKR